MTPNGERHHANQIFDRHTLPRAQGELAAAREPVVRGHDVSARGETHCSAEFNRRGRVTGSYVYNDPDELAHADLDVRPGELELRYIHISGPDIDVTIREHWDASFWGMLLFKSTALNVCISGSNERDILKLRTAVEQWGARHFETRSRLTQWLNLGVLAAGLGAVGVFTTDFDKQALATIMFGVLLTICLVDGGNSSSAVQAADCKRRTAARRGAWRACTRRPGAPEPDARGWTQDYRSATGGCLSGRWQPLRSESRACGSGLSPETFRLGRIDADTTGYSRRRAAPPSSTAAGGSPGGTSTTTPTSSPTPTSTSDRAGWS